MSVGRGINIKRCSAVKTLVGTIDVVPEAIEFDFLAEAVRGKRGRDKSNALVLEGADEAFDNGNGAVMADSAETLFNV